MTASSPTRQSATSKAAVVEVALPEGDPWMISIKAVGGDIDLEGGGEMNSSGERQFTVQVSPEDHLESLHDQIEASTGLKASQQRLIYRGRLIGVHPSVATPPSEKQTDLGDSSPKMEHPKIKDIAGLADGQTIHLLKRRESVDDMAENNRRTSATGSTRPRSSTIPSDGNNEGVTGETVSTGGLLATLLGLSSLTDDNEESATRRWSRSRLGRPSRRPHYRMTAEDRQVPDPGSLEPVRQGLMTLHTLLPHLRSNDLETPIESNRRWYRGQWLDCLDTVNAWLEATVVEIMAPEDILPNAYDRVSNNTSLHRREPQVHNDPAVSASDLEGRRRLLLEPCDPGDDHDVGGELSGFRPRPSNQGIQLLLVHYNGWPHRWDEWIRSDSARLRPFRTRTRHPNVSSTASPTPQSVFHEAPRTNILSRGDDDVDRIALLPELARVMASVNEVVQRQASVAREGSLNGSIDASIPLATSAVRDVPWISAVLTEHEPTPVEDLVPRRGDHQEISNLVQPVYDSDFEEVLRDFVAESEDDSIRPLLTRRQGDESSYSNDGTAVAEDEQRRRLLSEQGALYNRQELHNMATLLDRLGRTLTDAAPHIASLAANIPPDYNSEDVIMDEAVDQALEEIAASLRGDSGASASDTPIGGLLSLWSRERRNGSSGTSLLSGTARHQTQGAGAFAPPTHAVDPDHEDFVSGLVNTTRGEVRTGPRSRSSNDDVANLLGAYLAAAALGNGTSGDGTRDDGNSGLGQLLRGGTGGGGGIDIHIHAVVTGPGGTFGTGTGTGNTAVFGGTAIGGPRNLFSTNRRNNSASSVIRNGSRSGSIVGTRRRVSTFDEADAGIFDELYSETPEPIDPNRSLGSIDRAVPEHIAMGRANDLRDPDGSESASGGDYITGLNASYRSGGESFFGAIFHRERVPTDVYVPRESRQVDALDYTNVGAATLAGRGVSSTRRRTSRGSFRRESLEDHGENEPPRQRLSGLSRLFRRRSSRTHSDEQHSQP